MKRFLDIKNFKQIKKQPGRKWQLPLIVLGVILVIAAGFLLAFQEGWLKFLSPAVKSSVGGSRTLQLAYLSTNGQQSGGDIWRVSLNGENGVELTSTNGKVIDYSVSHDGNKIAYAQTNSNGGADIWLIDRDGVGAKKLIDCGGDSCSEVDWSPDDTRLAYSRLEKGSDAADLQGNSRIWQAVVSTGQAVLLYSDQSILGNDPSWSPDGKKIASYDTNGQAIRVLDLQTHKEITLPTQLGWVGCWSPDSQKMMFNDIQFIGETSTVIVYIANLATGQITTFLGQDKSGIDYSVADWSPDGKWIAISAGNTNEGAGKQLLVMTIDGGQSKTITDDFSSTFSSYHWDPSGKKLVYQQFNLGQSMQGPQILLWDSSTGQSIVIAKQAAMPEWLP